MVALLPLFILCLAQILIPGLAIDNLEADKKAAIDEFIEGLLFSCEKNKIAGINLAVVKEGEILYTTGYGVRNIDSQEPVTEDTLYAIASISKHFTTTLLGQILAENDLGWDDSVHEVLAQYGTEFYFNDPLRTNMTTLRDLGSHSVGILRNDGIWFQNMTRAEQANRLRFLTGETEIRASALYNNLMFTLLGHITEKIAGESWEELIQTYLFDKVGMSNTSFIYGVDENQREVATPYNVDGNELRETPWAANALTGPDWGPAAGIGATANDMAAWMNMLLLDGVNKDGEEVVPRDILYETRKPVNSYTYSDSELIRPPNTPVAYESWNSYALGLGNGYYNGYRSLTHSGGGFGHLSEMELYPDIGVGIYMSVNGDVSNNYNPMYLTSMFIVDTLMEGGSWLNASTACDLEYSSPRDPISSQNQTPDGFHYRTPEHLRSKSSIPTQISEDYVGSYGNYAYGNVTVLLDGDTSDTVLQFDIYECTVRSGIIPGQYYCEGRGDYWAVDMVYVKFDEDNSPAEYVDFIFFSLPEGKKRFERGLMLSDAPGPQDHWPSCD